MGWISVLVNAALAVIALWYTVETRRLRLQNQNQLKLLTKQGMLSLVPYLHVTLCNLATALALYEEEGKLPTDANKRAQFVGEIKRRFSEPGVKFICRINNETTKLATAIRVCVFESQSKTFLRSEWGRTVLPEKDSIELEISPDAVSREVMTGELRNRYGPTTTEFFEKQLSTDHTLSYVIVFFRDIGGNPYAVRREFEFVEDMIEAKLNQLILPQD